MAVKQVTVCDATGAEHPFMQKLRFTISDEQEAHIDLVPEKVTEVCQGLIDRLGPGQQLIVLKQLGIVK